MLRYKMEMKWCIIPIFSCLIGVAALREKHDRFPRMINGDDKYTIGWKFTAFINFRQPKPMWKVCGGCLVAPDWVLTVASCLEDIPDSPHYVTVGIGKKKLKYVPGAHNYSVSQIVMHPDYILPRQIKGGLVHSIDNDIALLKLTRPVPEDISPVVMADKNDDISNENDVSCLASGWGIQEPINDLMAYFNNKYTVSPRLKEIDVMLISKEACIKKHKITGWANNFYGKDKDLARIICGMPKAGKSQTTCTGDDGGPLVCMKGKTQVLYGLIIRSDYMCRPGKSATFITEVAKHRDWIDKVLEGK